MRAAGANFGRPTESNHRANVAGDLVVLGAFVFRRKKNLDPNYPIDSIASFGRVPSGTIYSVFPVCAG